MSTAEADNDNDDSSGSMVRSEDDEDYEDYDDWLDAFNCPKNDEFDWTADDGDIQDSSLSQQSQPPSISPLQSCRETSCSSSFDLPGFQQLTMVQPMGNAISLQYGNGILSYCKSPALSRTPAYTESPLHSLPDDQCLVCDEYEIVKATVEMLLGATNDLYCARNIEGKSPIAHASIFSITDTAAMIRLKTASRTTLSSTMTWFAHVGSLMMSCRAFGHVGSNRSPDDNHRDSTSSIKVMEDIQRNSISDLLESIEVEILNADNSLLKAHYIDATSTHDKDHEKNDHEQEFDRLAPMDRYSGNSSVVKIIVNDINNSC